MNSVYIYNANSDKGFSSLLMNDLNIRGISFTNLQTTRAMIYPDNVLIYIPRIGVGKSEYSDIVSGLSNVEHDIASFKIRIVPLIDNTDYKSIRTIFDNYFGKKGFKYYQAIGFDTLLSRIIVGECNRLLRRN